MLRRLMDSPLIIFHSCRKTKGLLNSSVKKVAFNSLKMATLIAASWFWRIIFAKCIISSVMKYKMLVIECHENQMMQKEVLQKTTIPKNILAFWFILTYTCEYWKTDKYLLTGLNSPFCPQSKACCRTILLIKMSLICMGMKIVSFSYERMDAKTCSEKEA